MIKICGQGKYGFLTRYGEKAVPCAYDYAGQFDSGLCVVGLSGRYGIIDAHGTVVVPLVHEYAYRLYETPGLIFELSGKYLVDLPRKGCVWAEAEPGMPSYPYTAEGERCLLEVDDLSVYMPGLLWQDSDKLRVRSGDRYGIIDSSGSLCAPHAYDLIRYNGTVRRQGRWGMLDGDGGEVLPAVYDRIRKVNSRAGISGDVRGDIVLASTDAGQDKVITSNGLLLCTMPGPPQSADDVFDCIVAACPHRWLGGRHVAVSAEGRYGVIQKDGVCGHRSDGQRYHGLCEVVPFVWDDLGSCERAYRSAMEPPGREAREEQEVHRIDTCSDDLIGPFCIAGQTIIPCLRAADGLVGIGAEDGVAYPFTKLELDREGRLQQVPDRPFKAYGIRSRETGSFALPAQYRRFVASWDIDDDRCHGFTALKNRRWYYVEIRRR